MLKIGHRGASGYAPENTLTAFRKAIDMGADGVELDVHVCKSGELVVIHDDTLNRTTDGWGEVAQASLAELQALKIAGGERIPTLPQVLEALGREAHIFIECKHAEAVAAGAELAAEYRNKGWTNLRIITFLHLPLKAALQKFPELNAGASFEHWDNDSVAIAKSIGARAILPGHKSVTGARVEAAHAAGLKVMTWTVNTPEDIARLCAIDVDGIMSDYPDRLKA